MDFNLGQNRQNNFCFKVLKLNAAIVSILKRNKCVWAFMSVFVMGKMENSWFTIFFLLFCKSKKVFIAEVPWPFPGIMQAALQGCSNGNGVVQSVWLEEEPSGLQGKELNSFSRGQIWYKTLKCTLSI